VGLSIKTVKKEYMSSLPIHQSSALIQSSTSMLPASVKSPIQLIKESVFNSQFEDLEDILPGEYKILKLEGKKLENRTIMTTGCTTCIGVVAKGYSTDGKLVKVGLHHFYGGEGAEEFLRKMSSPSKINKVVLSIFGGYEDANDAESMEECNYVMLKENLKAFSNISIETACLNPWKVNRDGEFSQYEEQIEEFEVLSLNVAVNSEGEIFVADAAGSSDRDFTDASGFAQFSKVIEAIKGSISSK
jgi:hypothetical protein